MSIHAKVFCSCFQRGRWPRPPFPLDVVATTGAGEVILARDPGKYERAFRRWKEEATSTCGHVNQHRLYLLVAYYAPWVAFVRAVKRGSSSLLSFLAEQAENPDESDENLDGALFPLSLTEELLRELRSFRASQVVDRLPGVVDQQTRSLLPLEERQLPSDPRVWLERDPEGSGKVVIETRGARMFSSDQLEIRRHPQSGYIYLDRSPAGGGTGGVTCPYSILKDGGVGAVDVVPFPQRGTDYAVVLDPLEALCLGALEEKNPIVWT